MDSQRFCDRGGCYWFVCLVSCPASQLTRPDIAFRDSHAIWAAHSSGMFSQIDLREATKPIDAIPRMAAAWEASGSLAFVADRKVRWEVPYDDMYVLHASIYYTFDSD